jgi:hypothetical protein
MFYWVIFQRKHTVEDFEVMTKFSYYFWTPILHLVLVQSRNVQTKIILQFLIHGKD